MAVIVGDGTTFVLTGTGTPTVGRIVSIGGFSESIADIDDTDLSTTGHRPFCPATVIDHDRMELTVVFNPDENVAANDQDLGVLMTNAVLTFNDTHVTPATLSGTGYIGERSFSGIETGARVQGTYGWRWDGTTGPAYTAGAD
jgi:hypothetical protein